MQISPEDGLPVCQVKMNKMFQWNYKKRPAINGFWDETTIWTYANQNHSHLQEQQGSVVKKWFQKYKYMIETLRLDNVPGYIWNSDETGLQDGLLSTRVFLGHWREKEKPAPASGQH